MHDLQKFLLFSVLECLGEIGKGSKIIHGTKAPVDSMLFMASVQNETGHVCGGFLITEDYVVTAAHCDEFKPKHVVLGNHNLVEGNHQKIDIEKEFKHESYKSLAEGDDIMLLKLSTKAQLGQNVQIIQLPSAEMNLAEKEECQVAGWGYMENDIAPHELRVVDSSISDNVICAGGYDTVKGICQGDSGGPLVCKGVAVGIVSFNNDMKCKYPDVPNVYTDIRKYLEWINSNVKHTILW